MTQRQMAVRIGMDGKADIQRDFDDVAASAESAYGRIGKTVDDGTAAIQRQKEAQDKLTESQTRADAARANQGAFNELLGVHAPQTGSAQTSASAFTQAFSGMEQRAAALKAQIDPLGAAQGRLNASLADANMLLSTGMLTETEHTAAVALARKTYDDTAKSLKTMADGEGLTATKTRELVEGIKHLAEGAAEGHLSMRQLTLGIGDLIRASEGQGLGGLLSAIFANPIVDIAALAAVVGGTLVAAYTRAEDAEHRLAEATELAGRTLGVTREQVQAFAEASASANDISVAAARDIEVAFAKTGLVTGQQLSGLTALTVAYFKKTGASMDEAEAIMVKAFADPAKAGEQLLASLGALDDKTKYTIDVLMAQNEVTKAQDVLQQKLTQTLKDATDQTTWYGDAWRWVKQHASDALETLSHGVVPSNTGGQLAAKQAQLQAIIDSMHQQGASDAVVNSSYEVIGLRAQVRQLQAQVAKEQASAGTDASGQWASKLSLVAGPVARQAIPGFNDFKSLEAQQDVVNKLANSGDALKKTGLTLDQVRQAQDAYNRAVATYLDPAAKAQKLNDLDIQSLNAKTAAQKVAVAEQREEVDLRGQVITKAEAEQRIKAAGARAYAEATAQLNAHTVAYIQVAEAYLKSEAAGALSELGEQKRADAIGKAMDQGARQVAQLDTTVAAQKRYDDAVAAGTMTTLQARQAMETERALAPLLIYASMSEVSVKDELTKIIERLTHARQADIAEQIRAKAQQEVEVSGRNLDLMRQELQVANDNDDARQVELAVLQKKSQLLEQGIDLESAEGRQIVANTEAATRLQQQLDLIKASRGEIVGMFDTIVNDLENGGNLTKDLRDELLKLGVNNPIKNMLFGTKEPTLGSVGGVFGDMFGGANSTLFGKDGLFNGTGLFGGNGFFANILHEGGMAGAANENRMMPADVYKFAPRYHTGVNPLNPGEVAAVLRNDERVLSPRETTAYNAGQASTGGLSGKPEQHFHLEGSVLTTDLIRQMNRIGSVSGNKAVETAHSSMSEWQETNYYERG